MSFKYSSPNPHLLHPTPPHPPASSSVAGAVGMTTSGESESDDSEMGRLQGKDRYQAYTKPWSWAACHCVLC